MNRLIPFLALLALYLPASSQIVNIEKQRRQADTTGFYGEIDAFISATKNTKNQFRITFASSVLVQGKKQSLILLGNLALVKAGGEDFSNQGFGHLRYNRKVNSFIVWEAFSQAQYNSLTKIDLRWLSGTGPRFTLADYDNAKFYWGLLYMFEYEELSNPTTFHNDHRASSYLSFTLRPQEKIIFSSTTYFQPLLEDLDDYRLQSDNQLSLKMGEHLGLKIRFNTGYDSRPPDGVPGLTYNFLTGLSYFL